MSIRIDKWFRVTLGLAGVGSWASLLDNIILSFGVCSYVLLGAQERLWFNSGFAIRSIANVK